MPKDMSIFTILIFLFTSARKSKIDVVTSGSEKGEKTVISISEQDVTVSAGSVTSLTLIETQSDGVEINVTDKARVLVIQYCSKDDSRIRSNSDDKEGAGTSIRKIGRWSSKVYQFTFRGDCLGRMTVPKAFPCHYFDFCTRAGKVYHCTQRYIDFESNNFGCFENINN